MELCTKCDKLIDIHEEEGDYFNNEPYCMDCLEIVKEAALDRSIEADAFPNK